MDTDIYLQYLHLELSKNIILIFSAKPYVHQIQPVPPYNARGNHSVRKVQDHFSCKNFDDLFHANRHHNFKEQL